ncbi:MAG: hypothetical protein IJP61_08795 [Treponema sp.]|nr:hypothetical protein [Treponema sp.]
MKRLDRINEMYAREELFGIRHENGKAKDFAYGDWTFKNYIVKKLPDTKDEKLLKKRFNS